MACQIKGSWKFKPVLNCSTYLTYPNDEKIINLAFSSNNQQFDYIWLVYGSTPYMYYGNTANAITKWVYGEYIIAESDPTASQENWVTVGGDEYRTIDFGEDWQEIDYDFYRFITSSAIAITGQIQNPFPIIVKITSPEGVTLATEKTIINQNIKVTIDESLLGGGVSGTPIPVDGMSLATEVGKIYLYTGVTNEYYTNGCLYIVEED